jgi:hypothetical protein
MAIFFHDRFGAYQHPGEFAFLGIPHGYELVFHGLTGSHSLSNGMVIDMQ